MKIFTVFSALTRMRSEHALSAVEETPNLIVLIPMMVESMIDHVDYIMDFAICVFSQNEKIAGETAMDSVLLVLMDIPMTMVIAFYVLLNETHATDQITVSV